MHYNLTTLKNSGLCQTQKTFPDFNKLNKTNSTLNVNAVLTFLPTLNIFPDAQILSDFEIRIKNEKLVDNA